MKEFLSIAKQLVDLTKNDSFANHFTESAERISKYWMEIMQFAINRKNFDSDVECIKHLLTIKTFEDRINELDFEDEDISINKSKNLLFVGPIKVYSVCAHHYAPIIGNIWCGYKPQNKIIGLSKLSRIAKLYARQPIVQELYTEGLFDLLKYFTESDRIVVITYMRHLCMESRGINDTNSITTYYKHNLDDAEFQALLSTIKFEKP
jgi:GTP cyclohydrolase I